MQIRRSETPLRSVAQVGAVSGPAEGGVWFHHAGLAGPVQALRELCLSLVDDQRSAFGMVLAEVPVFGGPLADAMELCEIDAELSDELAIAHIQ